MNADFPRLSNVEFEILGLLTGKAEMYGLEMVRASDKIKRGTVYVTLMRMEQKGFLKSRLEDDTNHSGLQRPLYSVTGLGAKAWRAHDAARAYFHDDPVAEGI
jgi:DNA-binding PadR family transcriptional regulator